jgi:nicotinamide riboside kinase
MRIAVTGAHKVGKTTLIEKLKEALPEYECKAEAYYELEEMGISFSEEPSFEDYLVILEHSIDRVYETGENTIFDRSPLDMLAYIQAVNRFKSFDIQSLYTRVQNAMTEIDLLVFVPIEKPDLIECSGSDLPKLRHKVNEILSEWVGDFSSNVVKVSGSVSERRDEVIKHVRKI